MDYASNIPVETFYEIISYLNGDETFPCLGVCKRWREILNLDTIWKKHCLKSRIFDPIFDSKDVLPLCAWANAYFICRCMPTLHWRDGNFQSISISKVEWDHYRDTWDGHYCAIYYYTFGKIYLYSIYTVVTLKQIIKVPLPKNESYNNASISMNDPYIVAARFNVAVIYKKNIVYTIFKIISVTNTFVFGNYLGKRNLKISSEIAWECLWIKADTIKDTFQVDLKSGSTSFLTGKPHLAFNDDIELVIAWTMSSIKVLNLKGDINLCLVRNKIRSIDFNSKFLVLKVGGDLEIIDIKTGVTVTILDNPYKQKMEFVLSDKLFLLVGDRRQSRLNVISPESGQILWSIQHLKGPPIDLRIIGSKFIFTAPSYSYNFYGIFNRQGTFIRECCLPFHYNEYPSPLFGETLPFFVVTNEEDFNVISFIPKL